jgi:hypothetical protein
MLGPIFPAAHDRIRLGDSNLEESLIASLVKVVHSAPPTNADFRPGAAPEPTPVAVIVVETGLNVVRR